MDNMTLEKFPQAKLVVDLSQPDSKISESLGIPDYHQTQFGNVNIVHAEDVGTVFPNEEGRYMGTPYAEIDRFLEILKPAKGDTLFDLGSGFGRVPIYGGMKYPDVKFVGIELSDSRTQTAIQSAKKLHLSNVDFLSGDVRIHDWSEATIFYMYKPFTPTTLVEVLRRLDILAKNAKERRYRLVCKGNINDMIDTKIWRKIGNFSDVVIYES